MLRTHSSIKVISANPIILKVELVFDPICLYEGPVARCFATPIEHHEALQC